MNTKVGKKTAAQWTLQLGKFKKTWAKQIVYASFKMWIKTKNTLYIYTHIPHLEARLKWSKIYCTKPGLNATYSINPFLFLSWETSLLPLNSPHILNLFCHLSSSLLYPNNVYTEMISPIRIKDSWIQHLCLIHLLFLIHFYIYPRSVSLQSPCSF